jgi:type II secretory pathway pseudopilin PulG
MKYLLNERGLSLIEVVASLVILTMALLLLSSFLVRSFELSGEEDLKTVAMNIARQTAEEWKEKDYLTLREKAQKKEPVSQSSISINGVEYQPKVSFAFFPSNAVAGSELLVLITVKVELADTHKELAVLQTAAADPN